MQENVIFIQTGNNTFWNYIVSSSELILIIGMILSGIVITYFLNRTYNKKLDQLRASQNELHKEINTLKDRIDKNEKNARRNEVKPVLRLNKAGVQDGQHYIYAINNEGKEDAKKIHIMHKFNSALNVQGELKDKEVLGKELKESITFILSLTPGIKTSNNFGELLIYYSDIFDNPYKVEYTINQNGDPILNEININHLN